MKSVEPSSFGKRLLEVFGEKVPEDKVRSKIAEVLGVKLSAVTNYLQDRIPDADKLRSISHFTNCSIHWLITGEGEKYLSKQQVNLDDTFREIIREMVREEVAETNRTELKGENIKHEKEKEKAPKPSPKK